MEPPPLADETKIVWVMFGIRDRFGSPAVSSVLVFLLLLGCWKAKEMKALPCASRDGIGFIFDFVGIPKGF